MIWTTTEGLSLPLRFSSLKRRKVEADFRPGFAWLEEQWKQPGVCLYLTDMECSSNPETEPACPVA